MWEILWNFNLSKAAYMGHIDATPISTSIFPIDYIYSYSADVFENLPWILL